MQAKTEKPQKSHLVNEEITFRSVKVIGEDGLDFGILSLQDGLARAREYNLDLVLVAPTAKPPVCKLTDYGKMKYELSKKQKKSSQQKVVAKSVKINPGIDQHDFDRKVAEIQKFLDKKCLVTVLMVLKGRQRLHADSAALRIKELESKLLNASVQNRSTQDGRITLVLASSGKS